ncbi:MAG: hypothetical protein UHN88_02670 [Eubacterium sp.]|nr:hypothetical protein [Eubacterium sp.]
MKYEVTQEMKEQLKREVPSLKREIRVLYKKLDEKFGLNGAALPVTFGYETDMIGAYAPGGKTVPEHFHFSLLFMGYLHGNHLHREDKVDIYRHEYAHYMQHHIAIPKEHTWQKGDHGSAWKYCCSLVGAAPNASYRLGQGQEKHDYGKALTNPWADPHYALKDQRKREKEYRDSRNRIVQYSIGDRVQHPKFGEGCVLDLEQTDSAVRLTIDFSGSVKKIDQKWLLKSSYTLQGR